MYSCALDSAGAVRCWGDLGLAAGVLDTPAVVAGLESGVTAIAGGWSHRCALTSSGGVKCWGDNSRGQLGSGGSPDHQPTPIDVVGLTSGVVAIAAGGDQTGGHTCALLQTGGVKCWGDDSWGQVGSGGSGFFVESVPVDVLGLASGVSAIAAGATHSCALPATGTVKCWGSDHYGELGDGAPDPERSSSAVTVVGLSGVSGIAAGARFSCALLEGGEVKCWGVDVYGQLGDGGTGWDSLASQSAPVSVVGLAGAVAVRAREFHACAIVPPSGLRCWGNDAWGQLGNDNRWRGGSTTTPVSVSGWGPASPASPTTPTSGAEPITEHAAAPSIARRASE
jgi:alpha-tubulin suppressor-like RCC1 family protein